MLIANSARITKVDSDAKRFRQESLQSFGLVKTCIEKRTQGITVFDTSGNKFNSQTRVN